MAYTLVYSGGTITVNDGALNTQTSLAFPGRNYAGYGTYIDQNMLSLLENFASSPTGPSNAIRGQIWFDISANTLKYNTSTTVGSPSWATAVTSGVGQNISVRNITMESTPGTIDGILTTRNITAATGTTATATTATGYITGQWYLTSGSKLYGDIALPTASTTQLGGIKVGSGLTINGDGVLSATGGTGTGVTRIVAGSNVTISSTGADGTGIVTINSTASGGGGGGTVTSVGIISSDLAVTNSPITGSGSFGLSLNTVPIGKGGTGQTTRAAAINALLPTQSSSTVGSMLVSNGSDVSWASFPSSPGSSSGYTTLPGGIILYWGSVTATEDIPGPMVLLKTVTFPPGLFSTILSISGTIYAPDSATANDTWFSVRSYSTTGMTIGMSERDPVFNPGPRTAMFQVIGLGNLPGAPTGLGITSSTWSNQGLTSTLNLTGTASGTAPLQYDWSIDGGVTFPITNQNPASFAGIDNYMVPSLLVMMRVRNSVVPGGIIYTQTILNPNFIESSPPFVPYEPPTCFPAGSKVMMSDGTWKLIEKIVVGDQVMSPDGPVPVVDVHLPVLGNRKLLSFADNSIRWSDEHLFWTKDSQNKQWWWSSNPKEWLREVEIGEVVGLKDNTTLRGPETDVQWAHLDGWRTGEIVEIEADYWTQLYLPITNGAPIIVDGYLVTAGTDEFKYDYTKLDWDSARLKVHELINQAVTV